jgi:RimJ/RimL family protein N-acetyltransferase
MYTHENGITLLKLSAEHLPILTQLKNESWFGTHNVVFVTPEDQMRWYESINAHTTRIFIVYLRDMAIGTYKLFNIDWVNRKYDMSYDIIRQYRGNGYSKLLIQAGLDFSFNILNMNRIDAEVIETNHISKQVLLKAGFKQEGVKRECIYRDGKYIDSYVLGMTCADWVHLNNTGNESI